MFLWYVINTYSGHENKVKTNLEHRIVSLNQAPAFRRVVVPTEQVIETKDGQKVQTEKRVLPGYVLVNMSMSDESWTVVKGTPGVTGFVGAGAKPVPLSQPEVDRILHHGAPTGAQGQKAVVEFSLGESVNMSMSDESWTVVKGTPGVTGFVGAGAKPVPLSQPEVDRILHHGAPTGAQGQKTVVEFSLGESVKVTSGPLSDFDGEIVDVNPEQQKLKVLVDIFERQVPVELSFDQVKKID